MTAPVKRYTCEIPIIDSDGRALTSEERSVVLSSDYDRLEQECERLRDECVQLNNRREHLALRVLGAESERDKLRGQAKPCQHLPIGWIGDATYCELCGEKL